MKKSKLLALLTAVMLIINTLFISVPAFADTTTSTVTRFDGANRYEVAVNVSKATYPNGTSAVILVNGSDATLADGLAAAPLAKALNAPILLTDKNSVPAVTAAEITRLGADKVYVVGGSGSVSDSIVSEYSATRIGGANRYEVAKNVAEELKAALGVTSFSSAFVCNGLKYADALAAAPFAAAKGEPILFVTANANDSTTQATVSELSSLGVTSTDAIGGSASLPDAVVSAVNGTRVDGANRAALSAAIATKYASAPTGAYVVNGYKPADALAVGPLAAVKGYPVLFVDSNGTSVDPAVTNYYKANASTITTLVPVGGTASVSDTAVAAVKNGNPTTGLAVTSVTAVAANQFKVVFNTVPTDTSKVTFTVKRDGTTVTVSPAWNGATATLTYSANFPEGTYTVDVMNDTTDLGTSTVTVTQQKVAKIALTSNTLAVTAAQADGSQTGYIGYQLFDQYGNDITNTSFDNEVNWTCGFGTTVDHKNGVLTLHNPSGMLISQFTSTVITAVDTNSAVSMSATVNISLTQGTLSSITLNSLTSPDNATLTSDSTDTFYIDYTAKDVSGNETKNYTLVKNGLLYQDGKSQLYTSSNYITAQLVQDPNDNTKAAIQVTVDTTAAANLVNDMPITITAISASGTGSSTLTVTLKKAAQLDTFTMMAPTTDVASGETVNIPFVAYDQNGKQLVNYSDINGYVTFSGTLTGVNNPEIVENADGTASLQATMPTLTSNQAQTVTIQAVTKTGKFSTLNITVQPVAEPTTLKLGSPTKYMEFGTSQSWDANDIFTIQDQYGRTIDLTNGNVFNNGKDAYYIVATDSASNPYITPSGEAYNGNTITLTAQNTKGSATVTFSLMKEKVVGTVDPTNDTVIDSKTATFTVVSPSDVVGYTLGSIGTIYNTGVAYTSMNAYNKDFNANPSISGKLANGASVVVNDPIVSVSSDNGEIYAVQNGTDDIYVYGVGSDDSQTANITVVVQNKGNNQYYSASNTVTAKTAAPLAQSMGYSTPSNAGVTVDSVTNTINVDTSKFDLTTLNGKQIIKWYNNDNTNDASIYLYAVDQYGKNDAPIANVQVLDNQSNVSASITNGILTFTGIPTNTVSAAALAGKYITLQAVSTNGKIETVKIQFK